MTVKTGYSEPTDLKSNMTMIAGPGENEMKTIIYATNLRSVLSAFIRGRIPRSRTHFRIAILSFLLLLSFLADPTPVLALDQTGADIYLPIITIPSSKATSSKIDVMGFMHAGFNYNGFTDTNSYLGQTIHVLENGQQTIYTPDEWANRTISRMKPGENVLYLSKGGISVLVPGAPETPETFWFNNDSIYDFEEGYDRQGIDIWTPGTYGLFHNFYQTPNSFIQFPYRGFYWSPRYATSGQTTPWMHAVHTTEYHNMSMTIQDSMPYWYRVKIQYFPNWDSSINTWDGKPDTGNLPTPLEALEVSQENQDDNGVLQFIENYIYAKNGTNVFGLVRYERWEKGILVAYNSYNLLTKWGANENPDYFFTPKYYSNPRLETTPTNGALTRGSFKLPGNGQASDGSSLHTGDWVKLTEILTDEDVLIAPACPDGYHYLGGLTTNYIDHTGISRYGSARFCGTNQMVVLAPACPSGDISRGWFVVGGKKTNFCVISSETGS